MLIFWYMKDVIKSVKKKVIFLIFCKWVDILCFFGEVFFIQRIIDFVFLEGKEIEVIFYAMCVFSIFIWQYSSPALSAHIEQKILFRYRMKLEARIYEKISKVRFECFENSAILEVMNRILDNPADRMVSSFGKMLEIISGAVSTIGVMAIIVKIGVVYMIGIIVLILFLLFLFQKIGKIKSNIFCARMELTKDKTVVVVTHRLGVAKNADKILVLEDGKLVETGTFEELQKMNGVFAKMWEEQAKWYRREG